MASPDRIRVAVAGASGYMGAELLRLLLTHPRVTLTGVTSERLAGEPLAQAYPHLRGLTDLPFHDLDAGWLASLDGLLIGGREDVLYVFHDPAQAIFRDDQTGELGLTEYPLDFNCRNAQPIHDLIQPLAKGGLATLARRRDGRPPELIKAERSEDRKSTRLNSSHVTTSRMPSSA